MSECIPMKITILDGNSRAENSIYDDCLEELTESLIASTHTVATLQLRNMDIHYCTGCFGCWVKTPGECALNDDSSDLCREYINSDLVLFASPVIMGFPSALLKKAQEKLICLILPYFELVKNELHHYEVHHSSRYDRYPLIGLLLEKGNDTDSEDIKIISDIYMRLAINFKTSFIFTRILERPVEEIVHEINSI